MSAYTTECLNSGSGGTSVTPISTPTTSGPGITTNSAAAPTTTKGSGGGITTSPGGTVSTVSKSSTAVLPVTASTAGADMNFAVSAGGLVAGILGVLAWL
jgi:hypothetical protein